MITFLLCVAFLVVGYALYGKFVTKVFDPDDRETPAITLADGVDYVAAKPAVLMGHHFSSIAGAGPTNGPIQASVFGWVPVFLWCIIGGIFFGGLQDYGSLFASIRNDGKSVGEIIKTSMGKRAQKLFIVFALLVLILVIASFVNVVAGTFFTAEGGFGLRGINSDGSNNNDIITIYGNCHIIPQLILQGRNLLFGSSNCNGCICIHRLNLTVNPLHHGLQTTVFFGKYFDKLFGSYII